MKSPVKSVRRMISGIIFSAYSGTLLLVLLTILQKAVLGTAPLMPRESMVPVLFGAVAGGLIGKYYIHAKELNAELNNNVNTLEDLLSICANCKKKYSCLIPTQRKWNHGYKLNPIFPTKHLRGFPIVFALNVCKNFMDILLQIITSFIINSHDRT